VGCNTKPISSLSSNNSHTKYATTQAAPKLHENYNSIKAIIKKEKNELSNLYKLNNRLDYEAAASKYLQLFEQKIVPSWLGTTWNFYGTTKVPQQGTIACGYFVTTTLFDMGVNINVAKYAQCGSDIMAKHLIDKKNYSNLSNLSFESFIKNLKSRKPFLAIVGLDFHTGYILNNGKELYFIHSSYINKRGVIKQIAAESGELKSSKWKSMGFITEDKKFIQNWVIKLGN
jgi:hypothetical protein